MSGSNDEHFGNSWRLRNTKHIARLLASSSGVPGFFCSHITDGSCSVLRSSRRVASGAPGDRGSCEEADEGISRGDPE